MAIIKERIEQTRLEALQDDMQQMELDLTNRLYQIEETINKLLKALLPNNDGSISCDKI